MVRFDVVDLIDLIDFVDFTILLGFIDFTASIGFLIFVGYWLLFIKKRLPKHKHLEDFGQINKPGNDSEKVCRTNSKIIGRNRKSGNARTFFSDLLYSVDVCWLLLVLFILLVSWFFESCWFYWFVMVFVGFVGWNQENQ